MAFEGDTAMIHSVTSLEFGHNVSSAKKIAREGPVIITDRGEPAFVLLTIGEYRTITSSEREMSLLDAMHAIPSPGPGIELELPTRERDDFEYRAPDFIREKAG